MSAGPVVVLMLTHRDPALVRRLVSRVLEGDRTVVALHHDPRGPELGLAASDRLLRVPDARPRDWGRAELARAVLDGVAYALRAVPELSWLLVVSGQDYPCRSLRTVEDELASTPADAFLRWFRADGDPAQDVHPWQAVTRRRYLHRRRVPGSHRSVPCPRLPPFDATTGLFVGDMWVNLGTRAAFHVVEQRSRLARVERYLSRCAVPDEALLPTLLLNDSGGLHVENDSRRWIRWAEGSAHPEPVRVEDVPGIAAGTDFFARKVDGARPAVLDRLDELARARS